MQPFPFYCVGIRKTSTMSFIDKLTDYLIARRLRKEKIDVHEFESSKIAGFRRVLNTLMENKVMVSTKEDGIYVRMAGNESKGEAFSLEWGKVYSFDEQVRKTVPENFKSI